MNSCFFVSDIHGSVKRFRKLFEVVASERPAAVFLGGDLLPHGLGISTGGDPGYYSYVRDFLAVEMGNLKDRMGDDYPPMFLILGNDDARAEESEIEAMARHGLCHYIHQRCHKFGEWDVYGYSCIPPSPFRIKDWERYDVSRHVDVGCLSPEEGFRTVPVAPQKAKYATIKDDLDKLFGETDLSKAIVMTHCPPYQCNLDRAALDGKMIDHVPLDVHIGSIAIQRLIESHQPMLTLHGHVHESTRLTGVWKEQLGNTWALNAAHDGPELCLVRFDPGDPVGATRELV